MLKITLPMLSGCRRSRECSTHESRFSTAERDSFFVFLASDVEEHEKLCVLAQNWRIARSRKDVECVFLTLDLLNLVFDTTENIEEIASFLSYSVIASEDVRDYVLEELLADEFIYSVTEECYVRLLLHVLTACCSDVVTKRQMKVLLKYVTTVPDSLLHEKIVLLKSVSGSLSMLPGKYSFRMSRIVLSFIEEGPDLTAPMAAMLCSIAKKVTRRIGALHAGFKAEIWKPFLACFQLDHELVKVCQCPTVIVDHESLPYKLKISHNYK